MLNSRDRSVEELDSLSPLLRSLYYLATRVPKIVLPRIEEEFPDIWTNTINLSNKNKNSYSRDVHKEEEKEERAGNSISDISSNNENERKTHNELSDICYICNTYFESLQSLRTHLMSHLSYIMNCKICGKAYGDVSALNIHYKMHSDCWQHKCETCGRKFLTDFSLKFHMLIHSLKLSFACKMCKRESCQCQSLKNYLLGHKSEDQYICEMCKRSYKNLSPYLKHNYEAHGVITFYTCNICKQGFRKRGNLKKHVFKHKKREKKGYKNKECNKSLKRLGDVKYNSSVLNANGGFEKIFECKECGRKYCHISNLKRHMLLIHNKKQ